MQIRVTRVLRAAALSIVAGLVLSAVAATYKDSFRSQAPGPGWGVTESSVTPQQGGGTLRFSAGVPGPEEPEIIFGGYINQAYALDYTKPWSIAYDYTLPARGLNPGAMIGAITLLGVGTGEDSMERIYAPYVYRATTGTFLGLVTVAPDGSPIFETVGQIPASGRLQVSYLPGGRRLQIAVNGTVRKTVRNAVTNGEIGNPGVWGIGCVVWDSDHAVRFTNGVILSRLDATGAGLVARPN